MTDADTRAAFETIYRENKWTNGSGPGSAPSNTIEYRAFLERFIRENHVRTVTDLGCGDWQFSKLIDWSGLDYTGFDVVNCVVHRNQEKYGQDNIRFLTLDDISDLPGGDLLVCKEVLQHLPNATIFKYVSEIMRKYRFALLTNAIEPVDTANDDILVGDWRPLRLDCAPFYYHGATILIYYPQLGSHLWRNGVFLIVGNAQARSK